MDKENVANTHDEILFSHKKKEILLHATTWMKLEDIRLSEKSQFPEGRIPHDSLI